MRRACVLLASACGTKARAPVNHHVEIRAMRFVPAELVVAVGDTITWTNSDIVPHTVTSVAPSPVAFDSKPLANMGSGNTPSRPRASLGTAARCIRRCTGS